MLRGNFGIALVVSGAFELALDGPQDAADLPLPVPRGDQALHVLEEDQRGSQRPRRPHDVLEEPAALVVDPALLPGTAEALARRTTCQEIGREPLEQTAHA